jgi:Kef-type K+ transport system membrane component KefB
MNDFQNILILMVVIWTVGKLFRSIRLPVVFGELIGGIIVGPMMLGIINPDSEAIKVLAELGIFFLMLHAGLETDHEELFKSSKKSIIIALGGAILPFLGGYYVAQGFGQSFEASLFIGISLSISAIALAARLFKDTGLMKSKIAHITLSAAIISDIIGLILFSMILNLAETGGIELIPLLIMLAKIVAFFIIIIYGGMKIQPLMNRVIKFNNKGFTLTLIIALFMGWIAELIGLHIIIGAFLAGLFMHEEVIDKKIFDKIEDRVYGLAYGFFGPIFFASLAFHLDLTAFTTAPLFLIAIVAVAILGKIIGSGGLAWLMKMNFQESLALGIAMNNRGAVELIIASIGLEMEIIDKNVFSILVIMAFATTVFSILTMTPMAKQIRENSK